ncbi:hypothetical protein [Thauera butanivorans]|uniref:hypothetical protein n=1 Tax=Thauera butanivorans TaxID=86174 RepID=UPI000AA9DAE1|nr:hypothetical protein [Thauera butanivorans]
MSDFNESRRITFDTDEISCRYLCIDLPLSLRSPTYTGKFGAQLKKVGIEKLPFGIALSDLILCGALVPSLYVALPKEYFENWKNFPECPRQSDCADETMAEMYACQPMPQQAADLHELLHPYDGELQSSFREKFQADIPESFPVCEHSSSGKYIPAEAYLPYWQVYALAGNFHKYRYVEIFLSPEVGKPRCLQLIKSAARSFTQKYGDTFGRVSWYKTIVASANFCQLNVTNGQLLELTQNHTSITIDLLKEDLRLLLDLDAEWHSILKNNGCTVLEKARSALSKDIYLIYEQLRLPGTPANCIFEDFTPNGFDASYTPLHDVLQSEGHGFKKTFVSFGSHYCGQVKKWGYDCTEEVFESLIQIPGFDAWIRAFHDLHESINDPQKRPVSFRQNRIVDALIVMSVRTEIVLREMFRSDIGSEIDEKENKSFFKSLQPYLKEEATKIIETTSNEIAKKTRLEKKPNDLFSEIDELNPKNWPRENIYFLHSLLKFITSRNYFAHHAYKDDELNIQKSALSRKILESLLATLLFFQKNKKAGATYRV